MKIEIQNRPEKHKLRFQFEKQYCELELLREAPNILVLYSKTDGYHWLQYWLSQDVNTDKLIDLQYDDQLKKVQHLFWLNFNIKYEQEDKETALLYLDRPFDDSDINKIADFIYPRFANRERFIDDLKEPAV